MENEGVTSAADACDTHDDATDVQPDAAAKDRSVRRLLRLHLAGSFCLGSGWAIAYILPFLARQRFDATKWQVTVLTAAVPVTQFFAIFWSRYYERTTTRAYLTILAVFGCGSIALLGAAQNVWHAMVLFVIAAASGAGGVAALAPLNADLLRSCYQAVRRGRVFGWLSASQYAATMLAGQMMGVWSDHDPDAFRIFFPLIGAVMAAGLVCYAVLSRSDVWCNRPVAAIAPAGPWWAPLRDMVRILRQDARFAGYEAAFMSYGVGWMVCTALVPLIATDRLKLSYTEFAQATVVAFQLTNLLLFVPGGLVADHVGPMRFAAGSFLWLTLYPIGLIFAPNAWGLGGCVVWYALGMVGVHLTWTLGPVALAEDPAKAPQYLAIHSTLVGVRGVLAQGLGVALYAITGNFTLPLLLGAAGFGWASYRMRRLAREAPIHAPPPTG